MPRTKPVDCQPRLAHEGDLPAIIEILNHEVLTGINTFRTRPLTDADASKWWKSREQGKYPAWVIEQQQTIVGWASLSRWSAYEGYDRTAEISVWLKPESQGQGLGSQLFQTVIQAAHEAPFCVILSRIEASNSASIALHRKFGFQTIGTMHRVGEKFGQVLDVVMMELLLK